MKTETQRILAENAKRNEKIHEYCNHITGEGSVGRRKRVEIADYPLPVQHLPVQMLKVPLVKEIIKAGSIKRYYRDTIDDGTLDTDEAIATIIEQLTRIRFRYDFAFWCATLVHIKPKGGGQEILFNLSRPQRKLVNTLLTMFFAEKPIRLIILKARQWGGSTCVQMFFAWLQLVHKQGLNSIIIAQVKSTATVIQNMYNRMLTLYPTQYLHELSEAYDAAQPKWTGIGTTRDIYQVPQRKCTITIGTAEKPDSVRGNDYNLVHCSEVGLWKKTDGKSPEDIVRSACSGIAMRPYTAIIYESTANGTGNFFHREYKAAKDGTSSFTALFVAWYEIDNNILPFKSNQEKEQFAERMWQNRNNKFTASNREEPGTYIWRLWKMGATLEAIHWYVEERKTYTDHGDIASEAPSTDIEAFVHSGERVFDDEQVDIMRKTCKQARYIGDIYADGDEGETAFQNLRFHEDKQGILQIWSMPETDEENIITDRYLTVVDVGGRTAKADWSVIVVFDRLYMADGDRPVVVAQWYGHIDIDLLAWKAAQIAAFYDNSLLVIESNTIETHDNERHIEGGDQSLFILNQLKSAYDNLYARRQSEDDVREGKPRKYGFHTNTRTKPMIITNLIKIIRENGYVERDERCLDEYTTYERKQSGAYGAIVGMHDDLLMTRAIGLHICYKEMDIPTIIPRQSLQISHSRNTDITEATI